MRDPEHLSHLDATGAVRMVEVGAKPETAREAVAECAVRLLPATVDLIRAAQIAKGDVIAVARVAGIMAAKRTPELIPLCHPLALTSVEVEIHPVADGLVIRATTRVTGRTGVEMEALTAAAVAGLTVIDMVKGVDREAALEGVRLIHKSGGRSGTWQREQRP